MYVIKRNGKEIKDAVFETKEEARNFIIRVYTKMDAQCNNILEIVWTNNHNTAVIHFVYSDEEAVTIFRIDKKR